jgi:hypothetical protein
MASCSSCAPSPNGGSVGSDGIWRGSLAGGAEKTTIFTKRTLKVDSLRAPNIIVFAENPFLKVGDKFLLENLAIATTSGIDGLIECQTVTAVAVAVAGKFEVATNATFASLTGAPTVSYANSTGAGTLFGSCTTTGTATANKTLQALICNGSSVVGNFKGYVYTEPPNTPPRGALVYITSGSPDVIVKGRTAIKVSRGDRIELAGTALVGNNSAVIVNKIEGRDNDNQKVIKLVLNVPVTGITVAATAGVICTDATISTIAIAPLEFTVTCGCDVIARLSSTLTSATTFPQGRPYGDGKCGQSEYCYVITDSTPGSEKPFEMGILLL